MNQQIITPPKAKKIETIFKKFGDVRIDNYYWLHDKTNPEVITHLQNENAYFEKKIAHLKDFQDNLFQEMKSRIKEDDESVPYKKNSYFYITRYKKGKQYPIYTRKKESLDAKEEIMFDVNNMAKKHNFYKLTGLSVSPDNNLVAFGVDLKGNGQYTLHIKNLVTGKLFTEKIKNTTGYATWALDNNNIFYTKSNPTTLRSEKVMRHVIGTKESEDILVYFEKDEAFNVYSFRTKSDKYLVIGSHSTVSSEYQILEADNPLGKFRLFQRRQHNLEYSIAHFKNHFYILTNADNAINFKLMKSDEYKTPKKYWKEVLPHREDVLLEDISIFKNFLVVEERTNGLNQIRIFKWDNSEDFYIPFKEETYSAGVYFNPEFDTDVIRYGYNSMTTPSSVLDFNVISKTVEIVKEQEVLDENFNKNNYKSERLWATANDGTKIPISLVYHKKTKLNSKTPLLLYGYGAYGITIDAGFSTTRLSLLDRGFVFAIAHVRGSEYLGRKWYESGKLLHKKNTFTDFISCAQYLIKKKYTSSKHLYASGGSAGGLLIGSVINMQPNLFNGVIASVPFVDVLTTMLNDELPLTIGEYDEWGNPNKKEFYNYIKTYSPYDNILRQNYPHILVTTGINDAQVQYFEPVKWVAKLRELKKNKKNIYLNINLNAGHQGASGRFDSLKEVVLEYSFIIELEGLRKFKKNY